ncbi:predicted protein [Histoplasma capsulatum var. duboisii H88]|uniref:Predicted protein n=1 Tax=Ajellomyces capsulatus (strain H88) TaxID=544711 RepID=F0U936_AJEC8|nr:predicted protein [Histoplasma capsulatum var. duboisii H88]
MCEHCVDYIFPQHLNAACDKMEESSKPCTNCNHEKKRYVITLKELKDQVDQLVQTHKFYLAVLNQFKEIIKKQILETVKNLLKQIKKVKTQQQKVEAQYMKSVAIALKASNTTISTIKKAKIKIKKTKLNIKRTKLEIEKKKVIIEKAKLKIKTIRLTVQQEILRVINSYIEEQKTAIENLTNITNNVNNKAICIVFRMYETMKFIKKFTDHLENSNEKFNNSNNSIPASSAAVLSFLSFFSELPTSVDPLTMSSLRNFNIFDENMIKHKASKPLKTPTSKHHMALGSGPPKTPTPIHKFNDMVDEKMAEDENDEKNMIQTIQKELMIPPLIHHYIEIYSSATVSPIDMVEQP